MFILTLSWDDDNVAHIESRHNVTPGEVEEACFSDISPPLLLKGSGKIYYVLGQTNAGRYLFAALRYQVKGKAKVITARDMNNKEIRRYKRR